MSMKENSYSGLNRGGCSLMGEDVTPTLISGVSKQFGTTQDKLNVIVSGVDVYNQEVTGDISASLTAACGGTNTSGDKVMVLNDQGGAVMETSENVTGSLRAQEHGHQPMILENHPADSRLTISKDNIVQTLSSRMGTGGGNTPMVMNAEREAVFSRQRSDEFTENDVTSTQSARQHKDATDLVASSVVRRLTPLECERLQGYPDEWTDIGEWVDSKGKTHKDADSPRYKALGNSIALPFWEWMAKRMAQYLPENATMASLFDGIGGFPLVFSRVGVTPVWASEIEEFPIAVTKRRFPDG